MKKLLFLTGMICTSCNLSAQYYPVMPASNTVADAAVSDTSGYVPYNNPAAISFHRHWSAGLASENKYLIKELMQNSLYLHLPTKYLHVAFNLMYNGFSFYQEWMTGILFSKEFNRKFSLGFQFNTFSFYSYQSDKYYSTLFPQLGIMYFPDEEWTIGFQVFNPLQTEISAEGYDKKLPAVYQLGMTYGIDPSLVWRIQLSAGLESGYVLSSGFEFRMKPEIAVKGGLLWGEFAVPDIGFSYFGRHLSLHLNTRIHPLLGLHPVSSVVYTL